MIDVALTPYEVKDLKSFAAGNPIPSSGLHALSDKGLLVFDATIKRHYRLTPTGTAYIEREKQIARDKMEALAAAARAAVKRTVEPEVKYTSMIKTGLMKEEVKLEKMTNGVIRIYFPHKPHWKVRNALKAARFDYWEKADYWSRQDDETALKFIQDWLSHDIYVGDDDETVETPQKPVQGHKQPFLSHLSTALYNGRPALILQGFRCLVNVAWFDEHNVAQIETASWRELKETREVVDLTVERARSLAAMWRVISTHDERSGETVSDYWYENGKQYPVK